MNSGTPPPSRPALSGGSVDLSNCDREPIHIPAAIQPHGALLAFDPAGALVMRSENAVRMLGSLPPLGGRADEGQLTARLRGAIDEAQAEPSARLEPFEVPLPSGVLDAVMHRSDGLLVVELEQRPADAPPADVFAIKAQRALARIQREATTEALLEAAVEEVCALTGFDRVMAYRFRADESGEVLAERRRRDLEPFLGLRYPASDIPSQARRLYVLNPLRLIADVRYRPVPLEPPIVAGLGRPLDLSHSVLRSVSPIHVEYLTNMGVAASMSVSIVVGGKLWGLFACHHYAGPRRVSYPVRMACELLSQVVSVLVERTEASARAAFVEKTSEVRLKLIERAAAADDTLGALVTGEPGVGNLIASSGSAVTLDRRVVAAGNAPSREAISELVQTLRERGAPDVWVTDRASRELPDLAPRLGEACGVLAVRFHRERDGYVFWFRPEQVETVRWGGNPQKSYVEGPLGPRLTPRGSFAEWKETVRGSSVPFGEAELSVASGLRAELQEVALAKAAEHERTRDLFMAALGHDLRNPLQAIAMAGTLLGQDGGGTPSAAKYSQRIASSTGRMRRLIDELLDASRLQQGLGLGIYKKPIDVAELVEQVADEARAAYPGALVEIDAPRGAVADVDGDRLAQVVANLLSNARHHGDAGKPVQVVVRKERSEVVIEVTNRGPEILPAERAGLFRPFKPESLQNRRNKGGLGLGLYISREIVAGHGGSIEVESEGGLTTFRVRLPS